MYGNAPYSNLILRQPQIIKKKFSSKMVLFFCYAFCCCCFSLLVCGIIEQPRFHNEAACKSCNSTHQERMKGKRASPLKLIIVLTWRECATVLFAIKLKFGAKFACHFFQQCKNFKIWKMMMIITLEKNFKAIALTTYLNFSFPQFYRWKCF